MWSSVKCKLEGCMLYHIFNYFITINITELHVWTVIIWLVMHRITCLDYEWLDVVFTKYVQCPILSPHRDLKALEISTNDLQDHESQRVGHGYLKYWLMQLLMTPIIHSGKLVDRFSSFVLSTLLFLSPCPVISLLLQLYFSDGQYYYFGLAVRYSIYIYSIRT